MDNAIWIVSAKRTPLGSFQGRLSDFSAPQLGQHAIQAAVNAVSISPDSISEVIMGCVLPAGCGQAPARQAALRAGLPESVACTTINKVCGSGMKSVMLAHDLIKAGVGSTMIAGGMESMTNAPYLLNDARGGMRLGHKAASDHMFLDGLQDAYEGELMGTYAQSIADKFGITRFEMDEWAIQSVTRSRTAQQMKLFDDELVPIKVDSKTRHSNKKDANESASNDNMDFDEHPVNVDIDRVNTLRPAFSKDGSVTAANSSAISDGAAALVLMSSEVAKKQGLEPLAIIKGHTTHARTPSEFTIAPVYAMTQLLSKLDWSVDEVDLWEINEAFAVITQIAIKELNLEPNKVNIKGGACALGHPIGASGARILVTLIHALRQLGEKQHDKQVLKGVASLCIGGGEATAIGIEVPIKRT
ncbi:thiolase family protein [Vibrio sp. 10N.261.55.A7]|uniref:thiolase family protein n=1 Tax=Vibrio sp. 10N.261.55.A7 TaxID=1880851 RepID=UPI000C817D7D|nr:thiolase family protein [Vibrio sp. 10N.261.55.A7]PMJ92644.1 acetyl-CoA acetyltransferase [Vibrio sp. 10N.261.55.A7]